MLLLSSKTNVNRKVTEKMVSQCHVTQITVSFMLFFFCFVSLSHTSPLMQLINIIAFNYLYPLEIS